MNLPRETTWESDAPLFVDGPASLSYLSVDRLSGAQGVFDSPPEYTRLITAAPCPKNR